MILLTVRNAIRDQYVRGYGLQKSMVVVAAAIAIGGVAVNLMAMKSVVGATFDSPLVEVI